MVSAARQGLVMTVTLILLSSCAGYTFGPLAKKKEYTGDVKLLNIQVPEAVHEDIPYDIVGTFESKEGVKIQSACFRWYSDRAQMTSPPLHCFAYEVQTNQPIGSVCSRWVAEGPHAVMSPLTCVKVEDVQYGTPGRFSVKLRTSNLNLVYSLIECYLEYLQDGVTKESNKVTARIRVEK